MSKKTKLAFWLVSHCKTDNHRLEYAQELQKYMVLYMSSCFWPLGVEFRGFSQTEKESTACEGEQIPKMSTFFNQIDNLGPFCEFFQLCKQFFLFQLEKNHVTELRKVKD